MHFAESHVESDSDKSQAGNLRQIFVEIFAGPYEWVKLPMDDKPKGRALYQRRSTESGLNK